MSTTLTGLRFRLEPNPAQERLLAQSVGSCRWLWNWALDYRESLWLAARSAGARGFKGSVGYVHLSSLLPGLKKEFPWLAWTPHHALQATLRDLDQSFSSFFAKRSGFPAFHRKGDRDSIRFPDSKQIVVDNDWVKLPKLGWIRFRQSRAISGSIRNATVSKIGPHWFVSFCVQGTFTLPNLGQDPVGLDSGVAQSVTLSTGQVVDFPVATAKEEKRLAWLQRQASRRTKGSARRRLANARVANLKRHLANRRRDRAHKLSTRLATTHRIIVLEDLNLKAMTVSAAGTVAQPGHDVRQKARLNRSVLANAHGEFRRMLSYKCQRSGALLIAVNPAFTSQRCSQCQRCAPQNRETQASFRCVACGYQANADLNAAYNILAAGLVVTAQGGSGVTPACELRTHPRDRQRKLIGSTAIPTKTAAAV